MVPARLSGCLIVLSVIWPMAAEAQNHMESMQPGSGMKGMQMEGTHMEGMQMEGMDHGASGIDFESHTMSQDVHRLHIAANQTMLTQKMVKELVLIALNVEPDRNRSSLEATRQSFRKALMGLRHGDQGLMLTGTTALDILTQLSKAEQLWYSVDTLLVESAGLDDLPQETVAQVSDLNLPLLDAMSDAVTAYEDSLQRGKPYSLLTVTVKEVERLGMLIQKMSKEYFLVAYGHQTKANQERLAGTIALFDSILHGLIEGDPELRLLAAPTPHLKASLVEFRHRWLELAPMFRTAATAGAVADTDVQAIAHNNLSLLGQIEPLIEMYDAL